MNNQQSNLNDVYELTRGELNTVINGLSKAPAESVFQTINILLARLQAAPAKAAPAMMASEVVTEETVGTEQ